MTKPKGNLFYSFRRVPTGSTNITLSTTFLACVFDPLQTLSQMLPSPAPCPKTFITVSTFPVPPSRMVLGPNMF